MAVNRSNLQTICVLFLPTILGAYLVVQTPEPQSPRAYSNRLTSIDGSVQLENVISHEEGCVGPGGRKGQCVRKEECHQDKIEHTDDFNCILKDGGDNDASNEHKTGTCCINPELLPKPVRTEKKIQHSRRKRQDRPPNRVMTNDIYPLAEFRICGRNGKKISRITSDGGGRASIKDWPWMAALAYRATMKQFCGGTLITKSHVLTASHCFPRNDPKYFMVILGDYNLKQNDDSKSRIFSVVEIITHEDYDVPTYENDIAIVKLNTTATYNSFIQPCCLPAPLFRFSNVTAVVTGWGKTEFGGPSSNILMEVPVPIWENKQCAVNFAQTVFEENLCAGAYEGGKDACQGDSGGPLVIQGRGDRWTIVGIVSWGIRCGEKNKPGIYTRVNDYLDWIAQHIS